MTKAPRKTVKARRAAAVKHLLYLGFQESAILAELESLLKVFGRVSGWEFIEQDEYSLVVDSLLRGKSPEGRSPSMVVSQGISAPVEGQGNTSVIISDPQTGSNSPQKADCKISARASNLSTEVERSSVADEKHGLEDESAKIDMKKARRAMACNGTSRAPDSVAKIAIVEEERNGTTQQTVTEDDSRPLVYKRQQRRRKLAALMDEEEEVAVEKRQCGVSSGGVVPEHCIAAGSAAAGSGAGGNLQANSCRTVALVNGSVITENHATIRGGPEIHGQFQRMQGNQSGLEDNLDAPPGFTPNLASCQSLHTASTAAGAPSSLSSHLRLPETRAGTRSPYQPADAVDSTGRSIFLRGLPVEVLRKDGIAGLQKVVEDIQSDFEYAPSYFGELKETKALGAEACDSAVVTFRSETSAAIFLDACKADPKRLLTSGCQLIARKYVLQTSDSAVCGEDFLGQLPQNQLNPATGFLLANVPPKWRQVDALSKFFAEILDDGTSTTSVQTGKAVLGVYLRPECSAILVQLASECLADALFYRCGTKKKEILRRLSTSTFICRHKQFIPLLGHRKCDGSSPQKPGPSPQTTLVAILLPAGDEQSSATLEKQLRCFARRAIGDAYRPDSLRQVIWRPRQEFAEIVFESESTANAFMAFYIDCTPEFSTLRVPLTLIRPVNYVRPGAVYAGVQESLNAGTEGSSMDPAATDVLVTGLVDGLSPALLTGALNEIFEVALGRAGVLERKKNVLKHVSFKAGDKDAIATLRTPAAAKALCSMSKPLLLASIQLIVKSCAKRHSPDQDLKTVRSAEEQVSQQGTTRAKSPHQKQKIPEPLEGHKGPESALQAKWHDLVKSHGSQFPSGSIRDSFVPATIGATEPLRHGAFGEEWCSTVGPPLAGHRFQHGPSVQPWYPPHGPPGPDWHAGGGMTEQLPPFERGRGWFSPQPPGSKDGGSPYAQCRPPGGPHFPPCIGPRGGFQVPPIEHPPGFAPNLHLTEQPSPHSFPAPNPPRHLLDPPLPSGRAVPPPVLPESIHPPLPASPPPPLPSPPPSTGRNFNFQESGHVSGPGWLSEEDEDSGPPKRDLVVAAKLHVQEVRSTAQTTEIQSLKSEEDGDDAIVGEQAVGDLSSKVQHIRRRLELLSQERSPASSSSRKDRPRSEDFFPKASNVSDGKILSEPKRRWVTSVGDREELLENRRREYDIQVAKMAADIARGKLITESKAGVDLQSVTEKKTYKERSPDRGRSNKGRQKDQRGKEEKTISRNWSRRQSPERNKRESRSSFRPGTGRGRRPDRRARWSDSPFHRKTTYTHTSTSTSTRTSTSTSTSSRRGDEGEKGGGYDDSGASAGAAHKRKPNALSPSSEQRGRRWDVKHTSEVESSAQG